MPRIEYGSLRQNLSVNEHFPNQDVVGAFNDLLREKEIERKSKNTDRLIQNEIIAKNLVNQLPADSTFKITRRCNPDSLEEISYQVIIKSKTDKRLVFGIPNTTADEKRSYTAFCLETKLLIRDHQGNLIPNQELVDRYLQPPADLPQTRTAA